MERSHALAHGVEAAELVGHAVRFGGGQAAGGQRADEEAESLLGGHAAGRGVRLREVALVGQVRHDVADGCRAQRIVAALGNGARSHRFAGIDVRPDNRSQNVLIPEIERCVRSHRPLSSNTSLHISLSGRMASGQIGVAGQVRVPGGTPVSRVPCPRCIAPAHMLHSLPKGGLCRLLKLSPCT